VARRLGQHFLRDPKVVQDTLKALELEPGDRVLEIGPGKGVLTLALAEAVGPEGKVVAVELDLALAAGLYGMVPQQVEIIEGDAVEVDLDELGPFDKVVGNLPYRISSPLTFRILDVPFERAVFLYQAEFAERLAAGVGDPAYGRLSVTRAYRAKAVLLRRVKKGAFIPPPRVMSALVLLVPHEEEPFDIGGDRVFFDQVVRELFAQRRKTLRKALSNRAEALGIGSYNPTQALELLHQAGVEDVRVEELSPEGYGRLAAALRELRNGGELDA
jgi:16S rRNA (adenine1518-N6/adenine1519-N6)-dimethyltransferase